MGERHSAQLPVLQGSMDTHQHPCLPKLSCFCLVLPVPLQACLSSLWYSSLLFSSLFLVQGPAAAPYLLSWCQFFTALPTLLSHSLSLIKSFIGCSPNPLASFLLFFSPRVLFPVLCGQYIRRLLALVPSYSDKSLSLDNIFKYGLIAPRQKILLTIIVGMTVSMIRWDKLFQDLKSQIPCYSNSYNLVQFSKFLLDS